MTSLESSIFHRDEFLGSITRAENLRSLNGKFSNDRLSYVHEATLEDGSKISFKFFDVIKEIFDTKLHRIPGRESYLSYFEVDAHPIGEKAYAGIFNIKQVGPVHEGSKSQAKHFENLRKLRELAAIAGIDLTDHTAWSHVFNQNYKR